MPRAVALLNNPDMATETHRLFFAIHPDAAAAAAIGLVVARLRDAKTVRGRWTAADKYHLTARFLGDHGLDAGAVIERARRAADRVRGAAFDVEFDRIATFRGRYQCPCILRCPADGEAGVQRLWRALGEALGMESVDSRDENHFIPHLTIAYVDRMLSEPVPIERVSWRARGFALVDSQRSVHHIVARWPLNG